jgi:hypothetical protein
MSRSYTSSPPSAFMACNGTALLLLFYPNVDKLAAKKAGKKIFVKSPARIELFKNNAPDTPLPPTPVITRWGTCAGIVVFGGSESSSILVQKSGLF